jgi:LacI family transcriptional regulator
MSRSQVIVVAKTIPTVVVANHDTANEYDSVVDDDLAGAALVVDHLVAPGHRHIAHTSAATKGGQWTRRPEQVRSEGYRQAMHAHGLDEAVAVAGTSYSEEAGYQAGRELLDRPGRPTAIFAGADFAALGVLRAAKELGLRIPADLSLVGYDNTILAASAPISLTSVDQAAHDLGATAARLLCERMDGRSRSVLTSTAPQLVVRDTTGPPPP